MEKTTSSNQSRSIPPPPPPPPLSKASSNSTALVSSSTTSLPKTNPFPISRRFAQSSNENCRSIVTYYKDIESTLQEGPTCGLVALSMASQFYGKSCIVQDILTMAKTRNFTKNGEMFSASNMACLAESLFGCKATVISDVLQSMRDILKSICRGCPVLIPYDSDKNHEPCFNMGRNAHWALLCGVYLELAEDLSDSEYERWGDSQFAYRLSSGEHAEKFLHSSKQTCVFALQGKSRHMAVWNFRTLLRSNMNMLEVSSRYFSEDMLLPNGDDAFCELRGKAVILGCNQNIL